MQSLNANILICFTDGGIVISKSDEQSKKVRSSMTVSEDGSLTFLMDEQFEKQPLPINFTDSGIMTSSNLMHSLNASALISVTESGISIFWSEKQPQKASLSISITDGGIVISLSEEQP